jgi:hypothetical protein
VLPACQGHRSGEFEQELPPWSMPGEAELDRGFKGFLVEFTRLRPKSIYLKFTKLSISTF